MSKLGCLCGSTIVDQADNMPDKGYILADRRFNEVANLFCNEIDSLAQANLLDKKAEWIKDNFGSSYPANLPDSSLLWDRLSSSLLDFKQYIYQCVNCGRIAIQIDGTNHYQFFLPETKGPRLILDEPGDEFQKSSD